MFCAKCGANIPEGSSQCPECKAPMQQVPTQPNMNQNNMNQGMGGPEMQRPPKPDNNLIWAILSTVLCCLPAGVVSIVFAAQVDGKYFAGDYNGALNSAKQSKTWSIVSAVVGLLGGVVYGILVFLGVMAQSGSGH